MCGEGECMADGGDRQGSGVREMFVFEASRSSFGDRRGTKSCGFAGLGTTLWI